MASNRLNLPDESKKTDTRIEQVICSEIGKSMSATAKQLGKQISGQLSVEEEGEASLPVVFSAFPNGDLIIWFLSEGNYNLIALVNQKFKHLMTCSVANPDAFQKALTEMQKVLGK